MRQRPSSTGRQLRSIPILRSHTRGSQPRFLTVIFTSARPAPSRRGPAPKRRKPCVCVLISAKDIWLAHSGFYWTQKDYEGALRELEIAGRLIPNDVEVESIRGYIRRRQGRWPEALASLEQSISRDPRNGQIAGELFATRYAMRDWAEAARAGETAMAVALALPTLRVNRSYIDYWARGDLTSIQEALAAVPAGLDPDGSVTLATWDTALLGGDFSQPPKPR